ncbi:hypothetical protein [Photobacterium iliopiscarium]|uniref:Uncharacterized protein n=1 Tax=Photobacterium iliopiscarium TaxID=56192 RepID=A0A2T3M9E3_9GAMM|nr:hypothetical protein [Photobacterium iliopiscarium]PSV89359.1 hypothetical protein C9I88_18975 [Photobacterium iliopiscarium]
MDLKDFIDQTLDQITEGVFVAQEKVRARGGFVNPALRDSASVQAMHCGHTIQSVSFDVAITVQEDSSNSAGAKLSVASFFKADGEVLSKEMNSVTSKVSFKVPLALPIDKLSLDELINKEKQDTDNKQRVFDEANNY